MGEAGGPVHLMGEQIESRGVEVINPQRRWSKDSSGRDMLLGSDGCPSRVGPF